MWAKAIAKTAKRERRAQIYCARRFFSHLRKPAELQEKPRNLQDSEVFFLELVSGLEPENDRAKSA